MDVNLKYYYNQISITLFKFKTGVNLDGLKKSDFSNIRFIQKYFFNQIKKNKKNYIFDKITPEVI